MYFVKIDLEQLQTRLVYSLARSTVDLTAWLAAHGFHAAGNGWCGSADSMNCLSCSEILYSERMDRLAAREPAAVIDADEYATAAWFV